VGLLKLGRITSNPEGESNYERLGTKMVSFCGTVTLQWMKNGKSVFIPSRIVTDNSFSIYLPFNRLQPTSIMKKPLIIQNSPPLMVLPDTNRVYPRTVPLGAMARSFDRKGLEETPENISQEQYSSQAAILT
jgi:hypothetical protein